MEQPQEIAPPKSKVADSDARNGFWFTIFFAPALVSWGIVILYLLRVLCYNYNELKVVLGH